MGMVKVRVPALFTNGMLIACESSPPLVVTAQTPFKCMHKCVLCPDTGVTGPEPEAFPSCGHKAIL